MYIYSLAFMISKHRALQALPRSCHLWCRTRHSPTSIEDGRRWRPRTWRTRCLRHYQPVSSASSTSRRVRSPMGGPAAWHWSDNAFSSSRRRRFPGRQRALPRLCSHWRQYSRSLFPIFGIWSVGCCRKMSSPAWWTSSCTSWVAHASYSSLKAPILLWEQQRM